MNIQDAQALRVRLNMEVDRWRAELWHCQGDSNGESWEHIQLAIESLRHEADELQRIVERRLTTEQSVIFGD